VVTVTGADRPFLDAEWLEPGSLVAALGSYEEIQDNVANAIEKEGFEVLKTVIGVSGTRGIEE
jgi:ornithine cyclodeaminase/alanine dehydrogenase-like protein (mu-crystallin family)